MRLKKLLSILAVLAVTVISLPLANAKGQPVKDAAVQTNRTSVSDVAARSKNDKREAAKRVNLILVLDKSGSMYGLESDTIGGYNGMIEKEKTLEIPVYVTTVLFDNTIQTIHDQADIKALPALTQKEYMAGGSTALYDAVGQTILKAEQYPAIAARKKGAKVLFVIITDGEENSSKEFSQEALKKLISAKREEGWEFIYLGANVEAGKEASAIGIDEKNAVKYKNTKKGVQANFTAVERATSDMAQGVFDKSTWREAVEEDKE